MKNIPKSIDNLIIDDILFITETNQLHMAHDVTTNEKYVVKFSKHKEILDEYSLMKELQHESILSAMKSFKLENGLYCYVMLYAEGGDLYSYFDNNAINFRSISENQARKIMKKLFMGIKFIHEKKLIHHDIKPENIYFMNNTDDQDLQVVIADFGLAQRSNKLSNIDIIGSKAYLPPEVLLRQQYDNKIDCWALGIIMYMLLYNCYPFTQKLNSKREWWNSRKIKRGDFTFPDNFRSRSAEDLIKHLICVDPENRYSAEQALNHEWFLNQNENAEIKSEIPYSIENCVN